MSLSDSDNGSVESVDYKTHFNVLSATFLIHSLHRLNTEPPITTRHLSIQVSPTRDTRSNSLKMPNYSNSTRATNAAPPRKPEEIAADILVTISFQDTQKASCQPIHPTSSQIQTTFRLCLSYMYQLRGRLSLDHYNRFLRVLGCYKRPSTFEETRYELSGVFEVANSYDLWEQLLDLVFPAWAAALEKSEQNRLARLQKAGKGLPTS